MAKKFLVFLLACLCMAGSASAATIFSRAGTPYGSQDLGGPLSQQLASSWVQAGDYNNIQVTIFGLFNNLTDPAPTVSFDIRQGAPDGTVVATGASVSNFSDASGNYLLFSGLSLAANTYYLVGYVANPNGSTADARWDSVDSTGSLFGSPGPEAFYMDGFGWITDQTLDLGFDVVGDLVQTPPGGGGGGEVPEPATIGLLAVGFGGLYLRKRAAKRV